MASVTNDEALSLHVGPIASKESKMKVKQGVEKVTKGNKSATVVKPASKTSKPRSSARRVTPSDVDCPVTVPAHRASSRTKRIVDPSTRLEHIRTAAYYLAERRGFESDHALDDWLAAEAEFDERLH